jgi:hypothetical protein
VPLITPEELVVFLDLPADTQPSDRAQLTCTLVIEAVNRAAGSTLTEPYAAGLKGIALGAAARLYENPLSLWSLTSGTTTQVYPGARDGSSTPILTQGERDEIRAALGLGGPVYYFPEPDWHWEAVASVLPD